MADPRLNSLHLDTDRRDEFRRARDLLLRARGSDTVHIAQEVGNASALGYTLIRKGDAAVEKQLSGWLSDGEFLYPLQIGVNTIGRSSDNDVAVDDPFVSRRHCAILLHSNDCAELHDTASKNGTYLNGVRLAGPAILKSGDELRISERQFVFYTQGNINGPSLQATLSS